ncbi:hypothetical protein D9611_013533 [Ephemerocybe angulata]|uniref:Uncharacterized protein n=1 Tax=Ephemerocybe angulata TaxID=980116 RepID=A0A8H5C3J7_9AGAR|nr:hypothetical protein D9611_013533 [Tulosesus angulatus]
MDIERLLYASLLSNYLSVAGSAVIVADVYLYSLPDANEARAPPRRFSCLLTTNTKPQVNYMWPAQFGILKILFFGLRYGLLVNVAFSMCEILVSP